MLVSGEFLPDLTAGARTAVKLRRLSRMTRGIGRADEEAWKGAGGEGDEEDREVERGRGRGDR